MLVSFPACGGSGNETSPVPDRLGRYAQLHGIRDTCNTPIVSRAGRRVAPPLAKNVFREGRGGRPGLESLTAKLVLR